MKIEVLYFARLRSELGCQQETLELAAGQTVQDLLALLVARGGAWAGELGGSRVFRVAINQELAQMSDGIPDLAEVAIFPPVTGG
ncbi:MULTISPECIES: molybdopterin converting factor subunit 1 [Chitinibacter]|uniref:molybdopterin converting factor subunit 1 n=1 Tax=Chitinibacter TaxID=230666 RepID=UPI000647C4DA|nr:MULTISPECIES: molybdopterin converting factor subunit 1 [Chitinibacter]